MNVAYEPVKLFEQEVAKFCGAPYGVAVESCSAAIFLCCKYINVGNFTEITIPKFTYPSVPSSIVNNGGRVKFVDMNWQELGYYCLEPTFIVDSAKRIERNMYKDFPSKTLLCLSFHSKKCLKIGRGGMVITDSKEAMEWLKIARFDGRHECGLPDDKLVLPGLNMYMTPEQAARGLELLQFLPDKNITPPDQYQDLSVYEFFTKANR